MTTPPCPYQFGAEATDLSGIDLIGIDTEITSWGPRPVGQSQEGSQVIRGQSLQSRSRS